jgi:hypothetical protein
MKLKLNKNEFDSVPKKKISSLVEKTVKYEYNYNSVCTLPHCCQASLPVQIVSPFETGDSTNAQYDLDTDTIWRIEEALNDYKKGHYHSEEDVKRQLGLS